MIDFNRIKNKGQLQPCRYKGKEAVILKGVSETLYIPLYGRASARKYGNIIEDPMAERIVRESGYDFDKSSRVRGSEHVFEP